jgi:hypothetical protein
MAVAGDSATNLVFYTGDFGLRLFATGCPATNLTFFSWTAAATGRRGARETRQTALSVSLRPIGYRFQRFVAKGILHLAKRRSIRKRFHHMESQRSAERRTPFQGTGQR